MSSRGLPFAAGLMVVAEATETREVSVAVVSASTLRAHVIDLQRGGFLIFPTRHRPVRGTRGDYRAGMRHGVATVRSGERVTLGIIFHDAA